jgi:hypothetical protein
MVLCSTISQPRASDIARQAHDRLTSPLPIIMQLFGPTDAMRLPDESNNKQRAEEFDECRLNIGPLETPGGCMFTIYKAPGHESGHSEMHAGPLDKKTQLTPNDLLLEYDASLKVLELLSPYLSPSSPVQSTSSTCDSKYNGSYRITSLRVDEIHHQLPYRSRFSSRAALVDHLTSQPQ